MSYIKHKSEESIEDYLETILSLKNQLGTVRSIDIANKLNYSKPSVSVAMKNLREMGYITTDSNGFISLTEEGQKRAADVLEKHTILSDWLISLGVEASIAKIPSALNGEKFASFPHSLQEWLIQECPYDVCQ